MDGMKAEDLKKLLNEQKMVDIICNDTKNKYSKREVSCITRGILAAMDYEIHCKYNSFLKKYLPSHLLKKKKQKKKNKKT